MADADLDDLFGETSQLPATESQKPGKRVRGSLAPAAEGWGFGNSDGNTATVPQKKRKLSFHVSSYRLEHIGEYLCFIVKISIDTEITI